MKNCVRCYWGLATMPSEVNVRFIALLSPFDRDGSGAYVDRHGLALDRELRRAARPFDGSGAHADRHVLALDRELRHTARPF